VSEGDGKTKIKKLELELFVDEELMKLFKAIVEGKKEIEFHHVYFRHFVVEEFKHEGLRIHQMKIPVGRITKLKLKVAGNL
jgi:hypothetical protein